MSLDREPLLAVRGLTKHYPVTAGVLRREVGRVRAVDGIDFDQFRGETLGLVGESGCGKSTTARCLLRIEEPTAGTVRFDGREVTALRGRALKRFRRQTAMVFQDATSSFDPRQTVGESVGEPLRIHGVTERTRRRAIVEELIDRVGLSSGAVDRYPHEFSGGQKQRLALARALVTNPELLVADEPVSALDVSVQSAILSLMDELQAEFNLAVLIISHDMGVVRAICDRVAVMYLGELVEVGPTEAVLDDPAHPYTRALVESVPRPDPHRRGRRTDLRGAVPDPANPPPGCRFHPRCPAVIPPDGYEFEDGNWRALMDLRVHLREAGIDLTAVREFVGLEAVEGVPAGAEMRRAIRAEFGLPERLEDPRAERVLREALELIVEDEVGVATRRLAEAFPTVCERDAPAQERLEHGGQAACHLVGARHGSLGDDSAE